MIPCQHSYRDRNNLPAGYATLDSRDNVVDEHDCRYVQAVDRFVDKAAAQADEDFCLGRGLPEGTQPVNRAEKDEWDRAFHRAMDALAHDAGVRESKERID